MKQKSRNHHWWPVALQSYWENKDNKVSWIEPSGKVITKRATNRKIGLKAHGHTLFRGSVWEDNFENEFDIDNKIHAVIKELKNQKPLGRTPSELFSLLKLLFKKDRTMREMCRFYHLNERLHRNLLLLIFSLSIRSPMSRFRYENYPRSIGLPPHEDTGKAIISQNYKLAKKICQHETIINQSFVLLHSPFQKFIFGDGHLNWLTYDHTASRINGRLLIPLTPHLCVYFCAPADMKGPYNCASLTANSWIVNSINEIIQIYSRDMLFFLGKAPSLTAAFRQRQFLVHKEKSLPFIEMLDDIAGVKKFRSSNFFDLES